MNPLIIQYVNISMGIKYYINSQQNKVSLK